MWERKHSKVYKGVSAQTVWDIMTDVNNWPDWHDDLDYCKLEGEFEVGNHFTMKVTNGPKVTIHLIEIDPGKSFTDCTKFFGAKMFDTHLIEEVEGGVRITNKLVVTGPLRWLWVKLVAKNVADTVPEEVDAIIRLAKAKDKNV